MNPKFKISQIKRIKNKIADDRGYPNWEEYENWISENNHPVTVAQLLVSAMDDVVKKYGTATVETTQFCDAMASKWALEEFGYSEDPANIEKHKAFIAGAIKMREEIKTTFLMDANFYKSNKK